MGQPGTSMFEDGDVAEGNMADGSAVKLQLTGEDVPTAGLGVTFCFSFVAFLMSTLTSLVMYVIATNFDTDAEFEHWNKMMGQGLTMFPVTLVLVGTATLMACVVENMIIEYSTEYTLCCLGLCIATLFG